jgi:integrase
LPSIRLRNGLSRFMRYCSAAGIAPSAVADDTAARFRQVIEEGTLVIKPNQLYRNTCHLWNEAAATVAGWPSRQLTLPDHRKPRESLSLDQLPAAFGDEVARHLDWLGNPDLFAEHRPPQRYKPRTVAQRRAQIGLAASALVRSGRPRETITSLADLVKVDAVKAVLRDYHVRNGNKSSAFLFGLAKMLVSVARHWLRVDAHHLEALRAVTQHLGRETVGLTEKNRATLKLLEDEAILGRLLALPITLAAKAARLDGDRAAIAMQLAVAIEILIKHPPRLSNLAALRLPANLVRPDGRHGPIHLVIPEHEVKNGQPLECVLTGTSQQLIDDYVQHFRHRLVQGRNEFLFPARSGPGHKSEKTLSQQIEAAIVQHVGIQMTCHQFRHLAAQLILADNPGALTVVSNVLGHRSLKTAFSFYGGNNPKPAAQHYDRLIEAQRRRPLPIRPARRRR